MPWLYHITSWPFSGLTQPHSLKDAGFVHLSSATQLLPTAERWYSEENEVAVLVLEQESLGSALVWEDLYGRGEAFPHYYAPLPSEALVGVVKMSRDAAGSFVWPSVLRAEESPLLEAPDPGEAFIEPSRRFPQQPLPEVAVLHFFPNLTKTLEQHPNAEPLHGLGSPIGPEPIFLLEHDGQRLAVCQSGVGAPLAAVALEEMIALGCRRFVMCGGAGSLVSDQPVGSLVLVERALRDEGVSHHYLPAGRQVTTDPQALDSAKQLLEELAVDFRQGATWTTDALYRETPARIARRKAQGCLMVEMEVASLLAVARYREVPLVPLLYSGDDLGAEQWNFRDWTSAHDVQAQIFGLATRIALGL